MTDQELETKISWAKVNSFYFWSTDLQKVTVKDKKLPISVNQVVYDSGASLCYLPTREFKALINEIAQSKDCWIINNTDYVCSCPDKERDYSTYPTIIIDIGGTILSFEPQWYLQYYENYQGYKRVCLVMILDGKDQKYWLMGDSFLRAYLTIYDRTNNRIGFVGNLKTEPYTFIEENR